MKFKVTVEFKDIGTFDNFFDAFKLFFEEIVKILKTSGMAEQLLETACWIEIQTDKVTIPVMFYDARDLAYDCGILVMPDREPQIVPPPSDETGYREYLDKLQAGLRQVGIRMAESAVHDMLHHARMINSSVREITDEIVADDEAINDPSIRGAVNDLMDHTDVAIGIMSAAATETGGLITGAFDQIAAELDPNKPETPVTEN